MPSHQTPPRIDLTPDQIDQFTAQLTTARPNQPATAPRARRVFHLNALTFEGPRYVRARVEVDEDFAASVEHPAQYTTMRHGELAPRFLVIASAPGERAWEFLVDRGSTLGASLARGEVGDEVVLSEAEGEGFAIGAEGPLLAFTTGSGVATMRPVLEHLRRVAPARVAEVALYYGEATGEDFALAEERARWEALGARIFLAREDLAEGESGWRYVQDAFAEDAPALEGARVLLSGAPIMMRLVSEALLARGVPPEALLTNV